MLSARNIHFIILGIIVGGAAGYVYAFYQAHSAVSAAISVNGGPTAPSEEHPEVSNEQMVALFREAIERNPNEPELLLRYANFLFDIQRYGEAAQWYQRVLELEPANIGARTDLGTTLWNMGEWDRALAEYRRVLETDPDHIMTLHNLFVAHIEGRMDLDAAGDLLARMEALDPAYPGLSSLRRMLDEERALAPR